MGADMLVECFWEEIDEKRNPVRKPDWEKGRAKIKEFCDEWLADGKIPTEVDFLCAFNDPIEKQIEVVQKELEKHLHHIETAYMGGDYNRELASLEFPPYRIFITGGFGDSPSDLYNSLQVFSELYGVLEATGLNPDLPDGMKILRKLAKNKGLQPLLIGKDKDLDAMLDLEIRKPYSKRKSK
jgi:hypothetical protein